MQEDIIDIKENMSAEKQIQGKKILIFILKVILLFAMPIIVSILDYWFL